MHVPSQQDQHLKHDRACDDRGHERQKRCNNTARRNPNKTISVRSKLPQRKEREERDHKAKLEHHADNQPNGGVVLRDRHVRSSSGQP
jgi:hypothetical protein